MNEAQNRILEQASSLADSDRDVIYLLRTIHQQQGQMNTMADQKANVLVATIAVLFSVVLTRLLTQQQVLLPSQWAALIVLATASLLAFGFGIYVLMPRMAARTTEKQPGQLPNPFFFGFFTHINEQTFVDFVVDEVNNDKAARRYLARDIYHVGQVLRRKYSVLRKAYLTIFIGGFLTLLTYIVMLPLD